MDHDSLQAAYDDLLSWYRAMVEDAPTPMVVLDLDERRFIEVNAAACALLETPRETLLKLGPVEVSPSHQADGRPSDEAALDVIHRAVVGEQPTFDWLHQTPGGDRRPVRIQLIRVPTPSRLIVRASMTDLRPLREVEQVRARLWQIVEATSDLVGLVDRNGRVRYLNPAGRRLLGLTPHEDLADRQITSFLSKPSREQLRHDALPAVLAGDSWQADTTFVRADGVEVPCSQVLLGHRGPSGAITEFSTIARDLTVRLDAERVRLDALRTDNLEALGLVARSLAHDFNNLLTGIVSNAEILRTATPSDTARTDLVGEIEALARQASTLTRQLLAFGGPETRERGPVDLAGVVRDAADTVRASLPHGVTLLLEIADALPPVSGDHDHLKQVVLNLVLNAVEALEGAPGEVRVRASAGPADGPWAFDHLPPNRGAEVLLVEVDDEGAGISPEHLPRLFDPFFSTRFTGRGLGLAAVQGIVRSHHGAVGVASRPGVWTRFRVALPVSVEGEPVSGPEVASKPWTSQGAVLFVDDEPALRTVGQRILERCGFEAVLAEDGDHALAAFDARRDDLRAVVLDMTMPGMSGEGVLAAIRTRDPDIPVILTSGYALGGTTAGPCTTFLAKPYSPRRLGAALRRALGEDDDPPGVSG